MATTPRGIRYPEGTDPVFAAAPGDPGQFELMASDVDANITAVEAAAGGALASHAADTTGIHGIADTALLVTHARTITAGTGLTGGGTLAADRTIGIAAGGVGTTELANDSVTTGKIAAGAVGTTDIADSAVTEGKIASGAVTSAKIGTGAVGTTALADDAVTTGKIATGAVGTTDLADSAVTSAKIATGAVGTTQIADDAITTGKIAAGAVGTTDLADGAVTSTKIADATIVDADISGSAAIAPAKINGTAVVHARTISTTAPLTGGGDLSADLTLGVAVGTTAGTVAAGNDPRLSAIAVPPTLTLATGTTDTLTVQGGITQTLTGPAGWQGARQIASTAGPAGAIQSGDDELGPLQHLRAGNAEWVGGNHKVYCYRVTAGSVTAAMIGQVWTNGTYYRTLLDVTGGYAYFSYQHNAGVTQITGNTPAGTWTSGGGRPSVDFTGYQLRDDAYIFLTKSTTDTGVVWSTGTAPTLTRTVTQVISGTDDYILAQQAAPGSRIATAGLPTVLTLSTSWRWPRDQPGVILVDVQVDAAQALTITQWSGLQMGVATGTGVKYNGIVGLAPGHDLAAWYAATPGGNLYAAPADWADGIPPTIGLTRCDTGGLAVGILDTSLDRTDLTVSALTVTPSRKTYPIAGGPGNGTIAAGSFARVSGFRSVTTATTDRHLHMVTVGGVTRWWLLAGSTGVCSHPQSYLMPGRAMVQTRGTARVAPALDGSGQATVTVAGWAEGYVG